MKVFLSTLRFDYHNRPLHASEKPAFSEVNDLYKLYCLEKANGERMIPNEARIAVRSSLVMDGKPFEVDPACNFIS